MTSWDFKKLLMNYLFENSGFKEYRLTEEDMKNIRMLENKKYSDQTPSY